MEMREGRNKGKEKKKLRKKNINKPIPSN